jgi:hypothetical protein
MRSIWLVPPPDWHGLEPDESGFIHLSIAEFNLLQLAPLVFENFILPGE